MEETPEAPPEPAGHKKRQSKRGKIIAVIAILVAVIIVVGGVGGGLYVWRFRNAANALIIDEVDLTGVSDGTYKGGHSLFHVSASVEVTVKDNEIVGIEVLKISSGAGDKAEKLAEDIIDSQSLQVDTVSGATASQKVFLKAIENALEGRSQ